jgi:hypothetical protein
MQVCSIRIPQAWTPKLRPTELHPLKLADSLLIITSWLFGVSLSYPVPSIPRPPYLLWKSCGTSPRLSSTRGVSARDTKPQPVSFINADACISRTCDQQVPPDMYVVEVTQLAMDYYYPSTKAAQKRSNLLACSLNGRSCHDCRC